LRQNPQHRRDLDRSAFTLTELLIVVAILGLLMSLVIPSVYRGAAMARQANCAKKLRAVGQAYHARLGSDSLTDTTPFDVNNSWPVQLRHQVGRHVSAFYCVEDLAPRRVSDRPGLQRRWESGYGHDTMETTPLLFFNADPIWDEMSLADSGTLGPGVWKVNETVYSGLSLSEGVSQVGNLPQYDPGSNPNVYYMLINDEGPNSGDADYEDAVFKVVEEPDGTATITIESKGSSAFDLDFLGYDFTVYGVEETTNQSWTFEGAGNVSYGMTSQANRKGFITRKILAFDFRTAVAHPNMSDPGDEWAEFQAPRHLGKTNVVFADGSVESMFPDELDPGDENIRKTFWEPDN
jgi:prepilin-type N-terminal cleavage/methylation domain-containing protein/prepilin-type processing-associated H-X9-DG protein